MGKEVYRKQVEEILKEEDTNVRCQKLKRLLKSSNYNEDLVSSIYDIALELEQNGKLEKAIDCIVGITSRNGEIYDKARELFPRLLYENGDYINVKNFFKYLKKYNAVNHSAYYYAAKVYMKSNPDIAQKYVEEAVKEKPDEIEYHSLLRTLYLDSKQYSKALTEIRTLLSLNIDDDLRNELNLCLPQVLIFTRSYPKAIEQIRNNKNDELTTTEQELLYFELENRFGDYNGAEKTAISLIESKKFQASNYATLMKIYNSENMCNKALSVYNNLNFRQKGHYEIIYSKAWALLQQGRYLEAKELLLPVIKSSNKPHFKRLYAFCLYKEDEISETRRVLEQLPCELTKMDMYLRYKLGVLDIDEYVKTYHKIPEYISALTNPDFHMPYHLIKDKYGKSDDYKPAQLNDDINIGYFLRDISDIVAAMKPNYTLYSDVYLISYGSEAAVVNDTPTEFFIVETAPKGPVVDLRPVIPTADAKISYQRAR